MTKKNNPKKPNIPNPNSSQSPRIGRQLLLWLLILGGVLATLTFLRTDGEATTKKINLIQIEKHLKSGNVQSLVIKGNQVSGTLEGGQKVELTVKENYLDSEKIDEWKNYLPQDDPESLVFLESSSFWPMLLINVLPLLLLVFFLVFFFKRQMNAANMKSGGLPFLKSKTELGVRQKPNVTFDDVAGVEEAKEDLQETVEFLKTPEHFQEIGGRIPRGLLLVGQPGTGKTLLAKAVAGEADVPFFSLCGSDFVELFVGVGASRVRDLFNKARSNQPCIIFLDEIDAVGRKRGAGLGGGHDEREQTLNAILSEMDGFDRQDGIIVVAATNRPDVLDPALLRPGRFDRQIVVDMPDLKGREAILKIHSQRVKMSPGVDLSIIARGTPGFSGADLEALINEAAIQAAKGRKQAVDLSDLEEARDKVRFGREKKSRVMNEDDRLMTAYHEAGHAIIAALHPDVEPLHKVSIIPRGVAMGMTMILPERDKYGMRKKECLGTLTMQMAGRVAEQMFCDDISSGAKNDIENATSLARKMVTQWGMSNRLGAVSYSEEEEHVFLGNEITRTRKHGEQIAQQIDEEIKKFLHYAYEQAEETIKTHSREVEAMVKALLSVETLTFEEVGEIIDGKSADEIIESRKSTENDKNKQKADDTVVKKPQNEEDNAAGDTPVPAGSPA